MAHRVRVEVVNDDGAQEMSGWVQVKLDPDGVLHVVQENAYPGWNAVPGLTFIAQGVKWIIHTVDGINWTCAENN